MNVFRINPFEIKLSEESTPQVPTKVQLLRVGKFFHDIFGDFEITSDMLKNMKANFDENVRRLDLAIDYKHDNHDIAAGWIRGLELANNDTELWATDVSWTPNGKRVLQDKEFRYLSAEFHPDYQDNESGETHGPTLLGAGLTNRPFVKEMAPAVELQEKLNGGKMTLKELEDKNKELSETVATQAKKLEEAAAQVSEQDALKKENEQLKEENAKLKEEAKSMGDEKAKKELSEKFDAMLKEGKVVEAQRAAFIANDVMKFSELAQPTHTKPAGNGGNTEAAASGVDVEDQILSLAEKLVTDKKAEDIGKAQSMVLSDPANKELRQKYEAKFKI